MSHRGSDQDSSNTRWFNSRWFIGLLTLASVTVLLFSVMFNTRMRSQSKLPGIPADANPPAYLVEGPSSMMPVEPNAVTAAVTLGWNAVPEPNIAGYRLYHGASSGTYTDVIPGSGTMVTVANLTPGSTRYFAVSAVNTAGLESLLSSELVYVVPGGATPPPGSTATPTAPPRATPAPTATATPAGTPGINVPATVVFTWVTGTAFPTPFPITVTTSNGASWTSFDTCVWFDTCPQGGPCTNYGASGGQCLLQPHTHSSYPTCNLTFSAPGLQSKIVKVTMKKITATPSPRPIPPTATPVRTPTPAPTTSPSPVPPTPTCTPCPCGN